MASEDRRKPIGEMLSLISRRTSETKLEMSSHSPSPPSRDLCDHLVRPTAGVWGGGTPTAGAIPGCGGAP